MPSAARTILETFDDSARLVAKLMARENITVQVVPGLPTAHMDLGNRVLRIPYWTKLSLVQFDMLICHEVGHALWTDYTTWKAITDDTLADYVNVLEDARIERKMRIHYPGTARIFTEAYRAFHTSGPIFQGTFTEYRRAADGTMLPYASLPLIDRINLHYKVGAFVQPLIEASEAHWIAKIDACVTLDDVIVVAKALLAAAATKRLPETDRLPDNSDDVSANEVSAAEEEQEGQDTSSASTSTTSSATSKKKPHKRVRRQSGGTSSEHTCSSITVEDVEDTLESLARDTTYDFRHLLLSPISSDVVHARTLTWCQVHQRVMKALELASGSVHLPMADVRMQFDQWEREWIRVFDPIARYMAQQFLARKNAREMQYASIAKTGLLDLSRLHEYRFVDDLFLRALRLPHGQSHGIVMLVDGSSSMREQMSHVIEQVLLFAHFAFYAQIPFQAFMFTTNTSTWVTPSGTSSGTAPPQGTIMVGSGGLIELMNTVSSRAAFRQQCDILHAVYAMHRKEVVPKTGAEQLIRTTLRVRSDLKFLQLDMTPLLTGMLLAESHLATMKAANRLDKMIFVTVSDGEDTEGLRYWNATQTKCEYLASSMPWVVRDTVTKRNYIGVLENGTQPRHQTQLLTLMHDVLHDRHGASTIYVFLVTNNNTCVADIIGRQSWDTEAVTCDMTQHGYHLVPPQMGVAQATILVSVNELALQEVLDASSTDGEYLHARHQQMTRRHVANALMPFLI